MMNIINAQSPSDIEQVRILFREYAGSLDFDLGFQEFEEELLHLPGRYALPDGCILLALHEGALAGCIALRKLEEGICEMKRLFVRPPYRHTGTGRALSIALIEEARRRGYVLMRLDTVLSMQNARSLYEALGFEVCEPYCYNPIADAVFMELHLQSYNPDEHRA